MSRHGSLTSKTSKVAYMEEEDGDGNVCNKTYAASKSASPTKERMNISKKKSRNTGSPVPGAAQTDSDSIVNQRREVKTRSPKDREKTTAAPKPVALPSRPAGPKQSKTAPVIDAASHRRRPRDDSAYYALEPDTVVQSTSRPRAQTVGQRPHSTFMPPPSRPPVSNSRYYSAMHHPQQPPPPPPPQPMPGPGPGLRHMPPPPPPAPFPPGPGRPQVWQNPTMPGSFPGMQPPQFPMGPPMQPPMPPQVMPSMPRQMLQGPPQGPPQVPPAPPNAHTSRGHPEYIPSRSRGRTPDAHQRFDGRRPRSSLGTRPAIDYSSADAFDPEERFDARQYSTSGRMSRRDYERNHEGGFERSRERSRPAPRRRSSSTRPASMFAPPLESIFSQSPAARHAPPLEYDDVYEDAEGALYPYQDAAVSNYHYAPPTRQRRPSSGVFDSRDSRAYSTEVARTTGGRQSSYYMPQSLSSASEKFRRASIYQDQRSSGLQLTAETLSAADRGGGPGSRSTRSSDSRDESDWHPSTATRTTRSAEEDHTTITVKGVKGGTFMKIGKTELQCPSGAEISFSSSRTQPLQRRLTASSDMSSYMDPDDRYGRFERPALHSRAASQTGLYGPPHQTAPPMGGYSYTGYDHAPPQYAPIQGNFF